MDGRGNENEEEYADYCLNQLGIRVWAGHCQLIGRGALGWQSLGPRWPLPVSVPHTEAQLAVYWSDALRVTAYQYKEAHPETDLLEKLETKPERALPQEPERSPEAG